MNHNTSDIIGHISYAFIMLGMICLAKKKRLDGFLGL